MKQDHILVCVHTGMEMYPMFLWIAIACSTGLVILSLKVDIAMSGRPTLVSILSIPRYEFRYQPGYRLSIGSENGKFGPNIQLRSPALQLQVLRSCMQMRSCLRRSALRAALQLYWQSASRESLSLAAYAAC